MSDVVSAVGRGSALVLVPPLCLVAALAALALPAVLVGLPPLLDYPDHYVRLWLLAGGLANPPLSGMYAADWSGLASNIGADLIAAAFGGTVGMHVLGPLLVAAAIVLPPLGAIVLNRVVFGGWHWWQVGIPIVAWNSTLMAGFLNYQIGLGLALLAAAADPMLGRRLAFIARMAIRLGLATLLLIFHPFAAAYYAALLTALAFVPDPSTFRSIGAFVRTAWRPLGVGCLALAVPLLLLLALGRTVPGEHAPSGFYEIAAGYAPVYKLTTVASMVLTYDFRVDFLFIVAVWAVARVWAVGRLLRTHTGLLLAAAALMALGILLPGNLGGTAFVDWRFPIMALLALVAGIRPGVPTPKRAAIGAVVLVLLSLARTAWIGDLWSQRAEDIASVRRALVQVPAGAAVLPATYVPSETWHAPPGRYIQGWIPNFLHYPALAVSERHAFVPTLFTARGKQPLRVLPPWDAIAVPEGLPTPPSYLVAFPATPRLCFQLSYVEDWRDRFDYVLLVNADIPTEFTQQLLPADLELLADEGFARLYHIPRRSVPAGQQGAVRCQ